MAGPPVTGAPGTRDASRHNRGKLLKLPNFLMRDVNDMVNIGRVAVEMRLGQVASENRFSG